MYHEGNPGARILEHEFLGVCIMKEILEQGSMYHEGNPGARILENEFLGVCIMKEILEHESWGEYVS